MKHVAIIGAGMMGSALAFPLRENGNDVRLAGTPLDREIIEKSRTSGRHPRFQADFPAGVRYFQIEEPPEALEGADFVICGVSSFGVDWFRDAILPVLKKQTAIRSSGWRKIIRLIFLYPAGIKRSIIVIISYLLND